MGIKDELSFYISLESLREHPLLCGKLSHKLYAGYSDSNASINRAFYWFDRCDCAILTAWRKNKTRQQNDSDNRLLQQVLREKNYGVIKVRGYYAENGFNISKENSFLTVNFSGATRKFFNDIRHLSESYNQDCFLFKKAGQNETPVLIGTNNDFGKGKIKRLEVFKISIKPLTCKCATKIGNKWIFS